jgi:hypothetical protein
MKKCLPALVLILAMFVQAVPAFAQPWAVGVQFGEQFSSLWGESPQDYALGFIAGVHASHYLTSHLVLRGEINWERRGSRVPDPIPTDPNFASEFRLDYLTVPMMFRYSVGEKWRWSGGGGVSVNFLMRERTLYGSFSRQRTDDFREVNADVLLCGGTAYAIFPKTTLSLDLRANMGLTDAQQTRPGVQRQLGRHILWGLVAGLNFYL